MTYSSSLIQQSALLLAQQDGGDGAANPPDVSIFQQVLTNPMTLIGGLLALFYVMVLLPEKRKKREASERLTQLRKNDRVVTIGGIHGTIVSAASDSDTVTIRTDESGSNRLRVNRSAIATVISEPNGGASSEKKEKTVK